MKLNKKSLRHGIVKELLPYCEEGLECGFLTEMDKMLDLFEEQGFDMIKDILVYTGNLGREAHKNSLNVRHYGNFSLLPKPEIEVDG